MSVFEHRLVLGAASVAARMLFQFGCKGGNAKICSDFLQMPAYAFRSDICNLHQCAFVPENLSDWEFAQFIFRYERTGTATHGIAQNSKFHSCISPLISGKLLLDELGQRHLGIRLTVEPAELLSIASLVAK